MAWNGDCDDTRGLRGTATSGTTATTKAGPRLDQGGDSDDSSSESAPIMMGDGGTNKETSRSLS